jgi:hypothetical protein
MMREAAGKLRWRRPCQSGYWEELNSRGKRDSKKGMLQQQMVSDFVLFYKLCLIGLCSKIFHVLTFYGFVSSLIRINFNLSKTLNIIKFPKEKEYKSICPNFKQLQKIISVVGCSFSIVFVAINYIFGRLNIFFR